MTYVIHDPYYHGKLGWDSVSFLSLWLVISQGWSCAERVTPGSCSRKLGKHRKCLTAWEPQALLRRAPPRLLSSDTDACDENRLSGQSTFPLSIGTQETLKCKLRKSDTRQEHILKNTTMEDMQERLKTTSTGKGCAAKKQGRAKVQVREVSVAINQLACSGTSFKSMTLKNIPC